MYRTNASMQKSRFSGICPERTGRKYRGSCLACVWRRLPPSLSPPQPFVFSFSPLIPSRRIASRAHPPSPAAFSACTPRRKAWTWTASFRGAWTCATSTSWCWLGGGSGSRLSISSRSSWVGRGPPRTRTVSPPPCTGSKGPAAGGRP